MMKRLWIALAVVMEPSLLTGYSFKKNTESIGSTTLENNTPTRFVTYPFFARLSNHHEDH